MIFPLMCFFDMEAMTPMILRSPGKALQTRRVSWSWKMLQVKPHPGTLWSAEVIPAMGERLWLPHCTVWSGKVVKAASLGRKDQNPGKTEEKKRMASALQMASPPVASLHPRLALASLAPRPHLQCCAQLWDPSTRRTWICWSESRGSHKDALRDGAPFLETG